MAPMPGAGTGRRNDVKYMLLIYQNPAGFEALSEEERNAVFEDVDTIMKELSESGEWIGGDGLADPSQTKTVKVRDGVPAVTDGPYLEAKEHLVGFCLFECESVERATEIATRWPDARHWAVEVRPLMEAGGIEM
jgi:hypothetical protein